MGATKLMTAAGGGITLDAASTASDKTITVPADNGTLVYANSSGNVGIGVTPTTLTAAANSLQVYGGASQARIGLQNATTGSTATSGFHLCAIGSRAILDQRSASSLEFTTDATERMRIDSSGKLLVAKTSATGNSNLQVSTTAGGNSGIAIAGTTTGTNYAILFYTSDGVDHGYISYTTSGTSYNTTSDYRLKENIAPMTGALSVVQQLKPCTYTWKSDGSAGQGFIAHELAEVVPDCVTGEKDAVNEDGSIKAQGIDTSFLVATLTAAIQELKAELDAAKADIATLKGQQ